MFNFFKKNKETSENYSYEKINSAKEEKLRINNLRIEEDIKISEDLKTEFNNNFNIITQLYRSRKINSVLYGFINKQYSLLGFEELSSYDLLIFEMYKKVKNLQNISMLKDVLCSEQFIYYILDKYVDYTVTDVSIISYKEMIASTIQIGFDNCTKNALLIDIFSYDEEDPIDGFINKNKWGNGFDDWDTYNEFVPLFLNAATFIRGILLSRKIRLFKNNEELFKIYNNLQNSNLNLNTEDIAKKMYPIYKNYYIDVLNEELKEEDFSSLIEMLNDFRDNLYCNLNLYEVEFEEFYKKIDDKRQNYNTSSTDFVIEQLEYFLNNIENKAFFDVSGCKYDLNDRYIGVSYIYLYEFIIKRIMKNVSLAVLLTIISYDCHRKNIEILKSKQENEKVSLERERLLRGDLTQEYNQEKDRLSFENIESGHQFEFYLKEIFDKLGYISEVTKGSGDQGADLILEKDNMKTVVQAKYYSYPVSNKAIQEVVASMQYYKADRAMVVTNSTFTSSAIELAKVNNVELINGKELQDIRNRIFSNYSTNESVEDNHQHSNRIVCSIWNEEDELFETGILELDIDNQVAYKDYINEDWIVHYIFINEEENTKIETVPNKGSFELSYDEVEDNDDCILVNVYHSANLIATIFVIKTELEKLENYYEELNQYIQDL